jgi:hypothetical protein
MSTHRRVVFNEDKVFLINRSVIIFIGQFDNVDKFEAVSDFPL